MKNTLLLIAILLIAASSLSADFLTGRRDAMELMKQQKNAEALASFIALAQSAATDAQKSDALEQASICADRLKQTDRALELASQIPILPVARLARMRVVFNARQWQEVGTQFKDDKIAEWPDNIRGEAFMLRGNAYLNAKDYPAAQKDLDQAVPCLNDHNSKGLCLNLLGDTYRLLNEDDKAIETYRKTYAVSTVYKQAAAAISIAEIFRKQNKPQLAVDELARIDIKTIEGPLWRGRMLCAKGIALIAAGKPDEGKALLNEALAIKDLPASTKDEINRALSTEPAATSQPASH